jgi:hypothetical protein
MCVELACTVEKVHHNHTKEDGFELDNNTPHDFQPLAPSRTCNTK